jgi:regulator of RNase E activity RraA
VVGDAEGVVVIPAHLADEVAAQAHEATQYDEFAAEQIRGGRSVVGLYPPTDASRAEHAAWRKKK